jgi:hypothetical protein
LLERESSGPLTVPSGPGERYVLGPAPPHEVLPVDELGVLPEAYGSGLLLLTARDPYWLYAHWDLNQEQVARYAARAADRHLRLRVFARELGGRLAAEVRLHAAARSWFVKVDLSGSAYVAELGYYLSTGGWVRLSESAVVSTPPDTLAEAGPEEFASFPPEMPLPQLVEVVKAVVNAHPEIAEVFSEPGAMESGKGRKGLSVPRVEEPQQDGAFSPSYAASQELLAKAAPLAPLPVPTLPILPISAAEQQVAVSQSVRASGPSPATMRQELAAAAAIPAPRPIAPVAHRDPPQWTLQKERALAEMVVADAARRVWLGSLDITELVSKHLLEAFAPPPGVEGGGRPASPEGPFLAAAAAPGSASPPFGESPPPPPQSKPFWFSVNAELVLYGATEPGATVMAGDRPLRLRPDGTFSCRFALPDGAYDLAFIAIASDRSDARVAQLRFSRSTEYQGEVGAAGQDPAWQLPDVAHVT